ncbi:hypothetical protein RDV84_14300 [Lysobacter yananisis]|uniref:Uncharacterized protein n=1 Tax=Lysobacter yananisis TaxID=1003114 RepID=A0ABY9P4C0_9GAMM|nr:hypothetical protein [Lysobacter yananisis]WMT01168.1 hypothetical protein RDV84_14300 [Lysobacter yananisis]
MSELSGLKILNDLATTSLRFRPKTDEPVQMLRSLTMCVQEMTREELLLLRQKIDTKLGFKLMYLSVLAAEKSINTGQADWLKSAVCAHVVEGMKGDYRENTLRLGAVEYSAWKLGIPVSTLLEPFKVILSDSELEQLQQALGSGRGENSLWAVGMKEEIIDGLSVFVSENPTP